MVYTLYGIYCAVRFSARRMCAAVHIGEMTMRKKSVIAILIATITSVCFVFTGCTASANGDGGGESAGNTIVVPPTIQNAQTFISIVDNIATPVTLASGDYIQSALLVYNALTDEEKATGEVVERKTKLDGYKTSYETVKAAADAEAERLKEEGRKQSFVDAVDALPDKLSFTDRDAVDAAYELYAALKAESKNAAEVKDAYDRLVAADEEVEALEQVEYERVVQETAEKFIADVAELIGEDDDEDGKTVEELIEDNITLESIDAIENLQYAYEDFNDDVLACDGVAEAKEKLDKAAAAYRILLDADNVKTFLKYAEAFTPVDKVKLESEGEIVKAERLYAKMSDAAKAADGVAEALEVLQAARQKFDELFAAAEQIKINAFIAAVEKIESDTTDLDITWFDVLDAASQAYDALAYATKTEQEVVEAYNKWNAVQKVFDSHGYRQITMVSPNLQFSGDAPPFLVIPDYKKTIAALCEFYGVKSFSELNGKVKMKLNVYTKNADGDYERIACGELDLSLLNNSEIVIKSDKVQEVLRALAADNDNLVSGSVYGFSLNFEDANGEYIPSRESNIVYNQTKPYTW